MDKDTVIKACPVRSLPQALTRGHGVENLHKKFCRSLKRSMFYGSVDMARNITGTTFDICDNFVIIKLPKTTRSDPLDTAGFLFYKGYE